MFKKLMVYGVSEGLTRLVPLLTSFFFAKYLGPEVFGKLAIIIVINEIIFIIISNNLAAKLRVDFFNLSTRGLNCELERSISYSFTFCVLFILLFMATTKLHSIELLLCLPVIGLLRTVSSSLLAFFQCSKNGYLYLKTQLVFVSSFCVSLLYLYPIGLNSWIYSMLMAVTCQSFFAIYCAKKNKFLSKFNLKWPTSKSVLSGLYFMPQAFGWWMKSGLDRIIISTFLGGYILGNFVLAFQVSSVLVLIATALNLTFVPEIAENVKKMNYKRIDNLYIFSFIALGLSSVILYLTSVYFFSNYYPEYEISQSIVPFVIVSSLLHTITIILTNELYFFDLRKFVAKVIVLIFSIQSVVTLFLAQFTNINYIVFSSIMFNLALIVVISRKIKTSRATKYISDHK